MKGRYTPDGITAMARQNPLLKREESDLAALAAAEEKRRRKAESRKERAKTRAAQFEDRIVSGEKPERVGKEYLRAEQRRLMKREKK